MAAVATVRAGADTEVSGTGMDPVSVQQRAVLVVDAACHVHVDILIKPGDDVPAVLAHHLGMQERACILAAEPDHAGCPIVHGNASVIAQQGRRRPPKGLKVIGSTGSTNQSQNPCVVTERSTG